MSTLSDSPHPLDRFRRAVRPPGSPLYTDTVVLVQILSTLIAGPWIVTYFFAPTSEVRIGNLPPVPLISLTSGLLVLGGWAMLLVALWRGPDKPSLFWGWTGFRTPWRRYILKEPADYLREGRLVPTWVMVLWGGIHLFLAAVVIVYTVLFLRDGRLDSNIWEVFGLG